MRLLLVEDDAILGRALQEHLQSQSHAVDWATQLDEAQAALATTPYDQILLDLALPDGRGIDFLTALRAQGSRIPVLILTAQDQITSRLAGLNAGADDYLVKPFDLSELSARIAAVDRRYRGNPNPVAQLGKFAIDLARREVRCEGRAVDLTGREWAVLARLAARPGAIVTRSEIETALYAFNAEIESNAVEVYVSRLRRKLGHATIATLRGLGYRLEGP